MIRLLIILAAGFILYKLFLGDRSRKRDKEAATKKRMVATGEMVKDPVCGTYVPSNAGIRVRDGDTVHTFCSYECRDTFLKRLEAARSPSEEASQIEQPKDEDRQS